MKLRTHAASEEAARQIKAVTDPLAQQMARLCELMREHKEGKSKRPQDDTTFFIATSSSSGNSSRSDTHSSPGGGKLKRDQTRSNPNASKTL